MDLPADIGRIQRLVLSSRPEEPLLIDPNLPSLIPNIASQVSEADQSKQMVKVMSLEKITVASDIEKDSGGISHQKTEKYLKASQGSGAVEYILQMTVGKSANKV